MAQSDIINNNFSKAFECLKCSNAYETGAVLSEEKLFKQLKEKRRSTFDKSKFTIVGSPTISDDGIASGFGAGKYIKTTTLTPNTKSWSIVVLITTGSSTTGSDQTFLCRNVSAGIEVKLDVDGKFVCSLSSDGSNPDIVNSLTSSYVALPNTKYYFRLSYDMTKYEMAYSFDNINFTVIASEQSDLTIKNGLYILLGNNSVGSSYPFLGSIDLKYFSITVDGKEMFCGNKTGKDVIKKYGQTTGAVFDSTKFITAGSPTVTSAGVASGFSGSNYLMTNYYWKPGSYTWQISGCFTTGTDITSRQKLWGGTGTDYHIPNISIYDKYWGVSIPTSSGSTWQSEILQITSNTVSTQTKYFVRLYFTGSAYKFDYSLDGVTWTNLYQYSSTTAVYNANERIAVGTDIWNDGFSYIPFKGQADLSKFLITINGNQEFVATTTKTEVGSIEVPYTLSKTGSKIVDIAHRGRVIDLYEQEGQAKYYTIDESNKNFTLPMGDIYGMIGDKAEDVPQKAYVKETYVNGYSWYRVWSDGWCEQGGQTLATTSATVTLLKEYKNTSYNVQLTCVNKSYGDQNWTCSSKSTNSFTYSNSETFAVDWLAHGYIS